MAKDVLGGASCIGIGIDKNLDSQFPCERLGDRNAFEPGQIGVKLESPISGYKSGYGDCDSDHRHLSLCSQLPRRNDKFGHKFHSAVRGCREGAPIADCAVSIDEGELRGSAADIDCNNAGFFAHAAVNR